MLNAVLGLGAHTHRLSRSQVDDRYFNSWRDVIAIEDVLLKIYIDH